MQPITVETCALIDEIENVAVSIFPNPAQTNCSIITSNECEVSLYSSDGKLIQEKIHVKPNLSTEFDVESLARGIYHFHINSGDYLIIRKVILH
jgi:hypothetical protein